MKRKHIFGISIIVFVLLGILASCSQINELPLDTKASNLVMQTGNTGNNSLDGIDESSFYQGKNEKSFSSNNSSLYRKDNIIYYIVEKPYMGSIYGYVYYFDIDTEKSYPLCSKPDCDHLPVSNKIDWASEELCTASLGIIDHFVSYNSKGLLIGDEEYLYAFGYDLNTRSILRYSFDGSIKEKMVDIGKVTPDEDGSMSVMPRIENFIKVGDEVFFDLYKAVAEVTFDPDDPSTENIRHTGDIIEVYSFHLKSNELRLLFEQKPDGKLNSLLGTLQNCGEQVVLNVREMVFYNVGTPEARDETKSNTFVYNKASRSFEIVLEGISAGTCGCVEEGFCYVDANAKELRFYEIETGKVTTIVPLHEPVDGTCYYFENYFMDNYAVIRKCESLNDDFSLEIYDLQKREFVSEVRYIDKEGIQRPLLPVYIGRDKVIMGFHEYYTTTAGSLEEVEAGHIYYAFCDFEDFVQGGDIVWTEIVSQEE